MNKSSKYFAVFKTTLKDFTEYRNQIFITYLGWLTRLLIIIYLWKAIFLTKAQIGNYTLEEMLGYFILVQMIMSFVFSHIGFHYARDINNGDLANFLHRPISYPLYKFVYELGTNVARTLVGISIYLLIIFLFPKNFVFHLSWIQVPLATISLFLSFVINYCLVAMIGMMSFWFNETSRLVYIYFSLVTIFSGLTIPLDLFPEKFFNFLRFTPFPYTFYLPVKILQNIHPENLMQFFRTQILFAILIVAIMTTLYRFGLKHYESSGR